MALDIRYARNGGVAIAYHVLGEGDVDLVYVPDYMSNLVFDWESPHWRPFYERLAQSFRLILFDKRGTGLSDHGPHFAALETRMEDLRAVLDAVGSSSTVVFGAQEGSGMAAMYAATYPERTRALFLFHPSPDSARSRTPRQSWPTYVSAGAPASTATSCYAEAARACTSTRRIGSGSRTSCGWERAPRSRTRSTAPSSRRI